MARKVEIRIMAHQVAIMKQSEGEPKTKTAIRDLFKTLVMFFLKQLKWQK